MEFRNVRRDKLRRAQLYNESTMQNSERERLLLRIDSEAPDALEQRAHVVHEQQQPVEEGEAHLNVVRHQMESGHVAFAHLERQRIRDNFHRSEQAAQVLREEVEGFTFHSREARNTSEDFHNI